MGFFQTEKSEPPSLNSLTNRPIVCVGRWKILPTWASVNAGLAKSEVDPKNTATIKRFLSGGSTDRIFLTFATAMGYAGFSGRCAGSMREM